MRFFKKVLILILIIGIAVGVVWGVREIRETRLRPAQRDFGEAKEKPLKFAVMSDIHSNWKNFRKALQKAKGDVSFVIITGDLTTLGKKEELLETKKILDESGLKYYVIPGNHDIWWGRKFNDDIWSEVFGKSFLSFKEDGIKFILINNADAVGGFRGFGDIADQMIWLENEAEECLRIYCLVFMHMPLNNPNSLHVMGESNTKVASEAGELKKLFVADQVKEIFAGHLHFSSSYELGGLKTNIVGAVTSDRNAQSPKFLEVEVIDKEMKAKEIFLTND